jgi:hypothetical protein
VVICALSLAVLVAMLFTGPLAGYLVRRRDARIATASVPPKAPSPQPETSAAPTIVRPPQPSELPRIVRLKEDSTTVLAAPPTLRILRREPTSDKTTRLPDLPKGADEPPSGPVTGG